MRCDETHALLDARCDGELDLVPELEIDQHLATCPACAARAERIAAVRSVVGSAAPRYAAPPQLAARIEALLPAPRPALRTPTTRWTSWAAAAALLAVMCLGWGLLHWQAGATVEDRVADQLVSNHVRSLLADHLVDIPTSDRHTVKPWFAGRIDFPPQVLDLKDQGASLVGGRIDLLEGRRVAALVYRQGRHVINLFMCPPDDARGAAQQPRTSTWKGFQIVAWSSPEMRYWAVSDASEAELQQFVGLWQGQAVK